MFRKSICIFLTVALGLSLWLVAGHPKSAKFGAMIDEDTDVVESVTEEDQGTLTLWYTDDLLTDFLSTQSLLYQKETGIKVNCELVPGVEYLELINSVSLEDAAQRTRPLPDLYITTHDNLFRAYYSGLAAPVLDPDGILTEVNFPKTALNAVCCNDEYVGFPLSYETNFFLYNKTYMASIAQNRIESEIDAAEGEAAQAEIDSSDEKPKDSKILDTEEDKDEGAEGENQDTDETDNSEEEGFEDDEGDPMGEEDALASPEVLERLATMIPATIDDIITFASNYDAPETVESIFEWDVSDIFYNYFFVGNYMEVGGEHGDNPAIFNIYNQQAVDCLAVYQNMNTFFSIDAKEVTYDSILQDFIDGKTVFTVATTDAIAKIEEAKAAGKFEYDYGVTVLPDISSLLKARGLSVTTAVVVNGYSQKQETACDFARFLSYEKSSELYKKSGKIACRKNVQYENEEITKIMDEYEKSFPLPKMVEASNYWVQLEIAFTKIWNGADPDETLTALSETIGGQIEEISASLPTQESFSAGAGSFVK